MILLYLATPFLRWRCFSIRYIYTYRYTYMHTQVHTCIHKHTYIIMYIHTDIQTYIQMYRHSYIQTYNIIQTYTYRHSDTYTYILARAWTNWPKPVTYSHYGIEQFSSSMDSSINKLNNYQYTTVKVNVCHMSAIAEACYWGLSDVHECSGVHWMPLVGLYGQRLCWKSPPNNNVGHGFSFILWQFECNGASLGAISPWRLQSSAETCHFVAPSTPIEVLMVLIKCHLLVGNLDSYAL